MPIIGIVKNMSSYVCPTCGGRIDIFKSGGEKEMAKETGVPFMGDIAIDPKVSEDSDKGIRLVIKHPNFPAAKAFVGGVKKGEYYHIEKEKINLSDKLMKK